MSDIEIHAPQVFISYCPRDKKWSERLQIHLTPLLRKGRIKVWADTDIRPGQEWKAEIETALASARVAVVLVTPDFLASDFIHNNELPPLLDAAHTKGMTIFWIAVSASSYEEAPFTKYQAANKPSQPLSSLSGSKRDRELVQIARKIKQAVGENSAAFRGHEQAPGTAAAPAPIIQGEKPTSQEYLDLGNAAFRKNDAVQAVSSYGKAAAAGSADGMNNLGVAYQDGQGGLPEDLVQAVSWYRKAAAAGSADGMYNLGLAYENGQGGLPQDDAEAVT